MLLKASSHKVNLQIMLEGKNMRRVFVFLLPLFFMVSCVSSGSFESQKRYIELRGNPSTGYTWVNDVDETDVISIEEKVTYLGAPDVVGAPSLFSYTLTSLKPGKATVNFKYCRPWEEGEGIEQRVFEVTVSESGRLKIK